MCPVFEIEGEPEDEELENEEEEEEEEEESNGGRGTGIYILLVAFIILFLTTASFFVYFQFYAGKGKFVWNLTKKNVIVEKTDTTAVSLIKKQNDSLVTQLDSIKALLSSSASLFTTKTQGEVYYVQIGAFRKFDFTKYNSNLVNMFVEVTDGYNKLIIGGFDKFDDACSFRKDIIKMGIKDAFIVKKVNGQRVNFRQMCSN
jgi:hypothetical protein